MVSEELEPPNNIRQFHPRGFRPKPKIQAKARSAPNNCCQDARRLDAKEDHQLHGHGAGAPQSEETVKQTSRMNRETRNMENTAGPWDTTPQNGTHQATEEAPKLCTLSICQFEVRPPITGATIKIRLQCHRANPASNVNSCTGWVRSAPPPEQRNPGT
mmetsp:Transcript_30027/g.66015  ORF Transcript_30027/g.66015 Transcript_30027/m.66015 type:complete len:159 (-) Transcript_30027:100-576(-)